MSWNLAPAPVIWHRGRGLSKWTRALINSSIIFISSCTEAPVPVPLIVPITGPFLLLCFVLFEVGWLNCGIQSED